MKSYKIEYVRIQFSRNSSEKLREETEKLLNEKAALGYKPIEIQFDLSAGSGYIFSYIVFEI